MSAGAVCEPSGLATRVLIVDDQALVREGLSAVISSYGLSVVGTAGDGETALEMFREHRPDVCIVDLRMSPMDGTTVTRALRALDPEARIIVLTTYDTDEEVFRALQAGAASYLLKGVGSSELIDTIKNVRAGRKVIAPHIASRLAEHVASESLTARQHEVLECIAQGKSNFEVAESLYISEGTVKAHVKAILAKLEARDRTQAIMIGLRRGLLREA